MMALVCAWSSVSAFVLQQPSDHRGMARLSVAKDPPPLFGNMCVVACAGISLCGRETDGVSDT
eukprot:scaffold4510_cov183-Amphora_coffeaeformis.AAC.58